MRDIAPPKRLHEARDRLRPASGDHEMEMVRHQHVGVEGASFGRQRLTQPLQENLPVVITEEYRLPVVATLDYMVRLVRKNEATGARHGGDLRFQGRAIPWSGRAGQ